MMSGGKTASEAAVGASYVSLHVKDTDPESVIRGIESWLGPEYRPVAPGSVRSRVTLQEGESDRNVRRYLVSPAEDNWVSVLPSQPDELADLAQGLSKLLSLPVLAFDLREGELLRYWYFEGGDLIDTYWSDPEYEGLPRTWRHPEEVVGHAERLSAVLPRGVSARRLDRILHPPDEEDRWDAEGLLADLVALLHIPYAEDAYAAIVQEGRLDEYQHFTHLAFCRG